MAGDLKPGQERSRGKGPQPMEYKRGGGRGGVDQGETTTNGAWSGGEDHLMREGNTNILFSAKYKTQCETTTK